MNIMFVDIDAIFWKAFNNIRLIDIKSIIKRVAKTSNAEKIICVADFTSRPHLSDTLAILQETQEDIPIEIVDGYSKEEERNLTDLVLTNLFYQSVLAQEHIDENTYTIICPGTKYFDMANFLQASGGNPVNFVLSDDLKGLADIQEKYHVIETMDLSEKNKSVFDKTVIKQTINAVQWGEKNNRWLTGRAVANNVEKYSKVKKWEAVFMVRALFSAKYLLKKMLQVKNSETGEMLQYKVYVVNPEMIPKIEKLLGIKLTDDASANANAH